MRYFAATLFVLSFFAGAAEPVIIADEELVRAAESAKIVQLFVQDGKGGEWSATCFYISETWLMTAAHTFKHANIPFIVIDGSRTPVTVVKLDFKEDMCILETAQRSPSFFTLQHNGNLRAIGFPGDTKTLTETTGTSNTKELNSSNPIYKGMSGGPVINESHEVVGMCVRSDPFRKNRCYAITSDKMIQFIAAARRDGK